MRPRRGGGRGNVREKRLRHLKADAVMDMICFTRQSAEHLVSRLEGRVGQLPQLRDNLGARP